MPVIIGKKYIDFQDVDVVNYEQGQRIGTLLASYGNRPENAIKRIILHWTGGENDAQSVANTLNSRQVGKLPNGEEGPAGCHFFVDSTGNVFQFQDLEKKTAHALGDNYETIGIEIQNSGFYKNGKTVESGREVYTTKLVRAGTDTVVDQTLLTFTPAQVAAVKKLCKNLCSYYGIPYVVPKDEQNGLLKSRFASRSDINNFTGICGHYHVDIERKAKTDPGTDLLESILKEEGTQDAGMLSQNYLAPQVVYEAPVPGTSDGSTERIQEITSGRFDSPTGKLGYSIVVDKDEDPNILDYNAQSGILANSKNSSAPKSMFKFLDQLKALKNASTLEMSEAVPVLEILVQTKDGSVVNLNNAVFSVPQLKSVTSNPSSSPQYSYNLPDRPVASLISFETNVQQVAVGGPTSFVLATLNIKVHNPHRLDEKDKQGKHIVNLIKQGYHSRIKFGVTHNYPDTKNSPRLRQAFQWTQRDFVTSQYKFKVNNDLSMDISIELIPSEQRLFSQTMIGENLPVPAALLDAKALTLGVTDQGESFEIQRAASGFNSQVSKPNDVSIIVNENSVLQNNEPNNIGNMFRSYLSNATLEDLNNVMPSVKVNQINALKKVQAAYLQSAMEQIFKQNAYLYFMESKDKNLSYPAINVGPLFDKLVRPEVEKSISLVKKGKIHIGETTSLEPEGSSPENDKSQDKTIVFLYGKFNSSAGRFANKPISTFPLNVDTILGYFKEQRDVGFFAGTINEFIQKMFNAIMEPENFSRQQIEQDNFVTLIDDSFEVPNLKYVLYKDPSVKGRWIFYIYDCKDSVVNFSKFLKKSKDIKTKSGIVSLCEQQNVPYIEVGSEKTFIRNLSGESKSSDLIQANNMFKANSTAYSSRQADNSNIPPGISREFLQANKGDLTGAPEYHTIVLPLVLSIDSYLILSAHLFEPIYVFFPFKQISGLYTISSLTHVVENGKVSSNMTLFIQESGARTV